MLPVPSLLALLQLASPALPLGAYAYSEGLEFLTQSQIQNAEALLTWLRQELGYGSIRIESAVMLRGHRCWRLGEELNGLNHWNQWLGAQRETSELRRQSQQMGRSLLQLLAQLTEEPRFSSIAETFNSPCHYALAFGMGAAHWQIPEEAALLGYLHSWASNLITAGVKLIPLGQTAGQRLLQALSADIGEQCPGLLALEDDNLYSCSLGLALASMGHEAQYSRLFRS
ncbi:MAG: urease accessory protein UreF [Cyanobacteriota bacterium]|jgi:urease accessory protein